jgi:periplasmic protein TonB
MHRAASIILLIFFSSSISLAQDIEIEIKNESIENTDHQIIDPIEVIPRLPGGEAELRKFISNNLSRKNIPDSIKGRVFVQFDVEKTGELKNVTVVRGLCPPCDSEAIRIVSSMPNWIPGTQLGKVVRMRMVLPVTF